MTDQPSDYSVQDENRINLKFLFFKYFVRFWYIYILCLACTFTIAYYYNWYTTPVYQASCTILIKDESRGIGSTDLLQQVNAIDNKGGIENDLELIKSRTNVGRTLRKLDFDVSYTLIGNIKTAELYKDSPIKLHYDSLSFRIYEQDIYIEVIDSKKYKISYALKNDDQNIEY